MGIVKFKFKKIFFYENKTIKPANGKEKVKKREIIKRNINKLSHNFFCCRALELFSTA